MNSDPNKCLNPHGGGGGFPYLRYHEGKRERVVDSESFLKKDFTEKEPEDSRVHLNLSSREGESRIDWRESKSESRSLESILEKPIRGP